MEYHKPKKVGEAIGLLTMGKGDHALLAGGTDLLVQIRTGARRLKGVIDISEIESLKGVTDGERAIEIGAMVTHSEIAESELVRTHAPALAQACLTIGGVQIQNRGTIGGNVMNASPAGDTLPAIVAYESEFLVQDLKGERWISFDAFFTGYRKTQVGAQEMLTRIRIPKADPKERAAFYKIGQRRAQAISKVSLCARARIRHGGVEWAKIALGSVADRAIRARGTEALLAGKVVTANLIDVARESIADEVAPIDDIRSTADYRKFAAGGLLARFLRQVIETP